MSVREIVNSNGNIKQSVMGFSVLQQGTIAFNGAGGNTNTVPCVGYDATNCVVNYVVVENTSGTASVVCETLAAASVSNTSFDAKATAAFAGTVRYQVIQTASTTPTVNVP